MWFRKRVRVFNAIESIEDDITQLADIVMSLKESIEKLTKDIACLHSENILVREELTKKNQFIEDLLSQMIGGAVTSIAGPKREIAATTNGVDKPMSKTMENYLAKKNNETIKRLPG